MALPQDVAQTGCDDAYKAEIKDLTANLFLNIVTASNQAEKDEAKAAYQRGMQVAKEVHEINTEVIGIIFA